ncbi:DNA polymerase III subunit gamma and tau [Nocardia barduliensis]|uniref:DNA polymerase III subunit gamma and tau n=1 Tax=Nocardia barduliensis TaxID=2736643 RepID=UPI003F68B825
MALYRKYRPATFAEVVGQEHVTDPLSTALDMGRISHAYLFSGPRGCGKTSSARILARSLNCAQGPTSTPCGTCPSCVALGPGGPGNLDVIELDAASHGGVDDTRELRDRAFYAPAESRYRVFIVDEAHMVTTAGFNALLKIVEEPPAHLIFIFATTEPDKVLPTIRSRTHHYPFRLLPPATMRGLLGRICEQEHVPVEEAVYPLVIRAGGGSPRDSLSVLDQLLAGAGPEGVTYARAVSLLGVTDVALIDDAVEALAADDGAVLFGTVDRVMEAGHDPRRFAVDLLDRFRDLILLRAVPDAVERGLVTGPGDVLDRMRDQAARLGSATLTRYAELLHDGLGEMRGATAPRLLLEVVCARMLLPSVSDAESATLQRLERLERGLAGGSVAVPTASPAPPPAAGGSPTDPPRRRGAEALAAIRRDNRGAGRSEDASEAGGAAPAGGPAQTGGAEAAVRGGGAVAAGGPAQTGGAVATGGVEDPVRAGGAAAGGSPQAGGAEALVHGGGSAQAGRAERPVRADGSFAEVAADAPAPVGGEPAGTPAAGGVGSTVAAPDGGAAVDGGESAGAGDGRRVTAADRASSVGRFAPGTGAEGGADRNAPIAEPESGAGPGGGSARGTSSGGPSAPDAPSGTTDASAGAGARDYGVASGASEGADSRVSGAQAAGSVAGHDPATIDSTAARNAAAGRGDRERSDVIPAQPTDAPSPRGTAGPSSHGTDVPVSRATDASASAGTDVPSSRSIDASVSAGADASVSRGSHASAGTDAPSSRAIDASVSRATGAPAPEPAAGTSSAPGGDLLREVEAAWADIRTKVREFGAAVQAMLAGASVARVEGEVIVFAHQHAPLAQRLSDPRNLEAVRSAVRAVLGRDHEVRWEAGGAAPRPAAAPRSGGAGNRGRGQAGSQPGRESGNAAGRAPDAAAPPRFSRPSQARNTGADKPGNAGRSRGSGANPRPYPADDDIPPPDYPDLPDDPGPADYPPPYDAEPSGNEDVSSRGRGGDGAIPAPTPEEEREMMAAAADPVAPGDRRDPDEVALELLKSELGATRLDG